MRSYKSIYLCIICTILTIILFRILLPFGDEPDFIFRAPRFIDGNLPTLAYYILSPIYYLFSDFELHNNCIVTPVLPGFYYELSNCSNDIYGVFSRVIYSLYLLFVLLIIIFTSKNENYNLKSSVIIASFFSGTIYYMGVLSYEGISIILSMLVVFYIKNRITSFILVVAVLSLDLGDGIVVLAFFTLYNSFVFFTDSHRKTALLTCTLVFLSLILGLAFIEIISNISLFSSKANSLLDVKDDIIERSNKYPILLRPIITYISSIMYTPRGVFSFLSIFILSLFLFLAVVKRKFRIFFTTGDPFVYHLFYSSVSLVLCLVFILPTYANAKYFIFILPSIIYPFLTFYGFKKIFILFFLVNLSLIFTLLLSNIS